MDNNTNWNQIKDLGFAEPFDDPQSVDYSDMIRSLRDDNLEPHPIDSYSTSPFNFEESARILWEDTQLVYYHACSANYASDNYLKLCAILEKNIKQVGSMCITKAALEQEGLSFPELDNLNIDELLGMTAFHLRKCHASFRDIYEKQEKLGLSYLNWEFRWFQLGNRLNATEVKIQKIRSNEIKIDSILKETRTSETKDNAEPKREISNPEALRFNPNALPINGSIARETIRTLKQGQQAEENERKFLHDAMSIWGKPDNTLIDNIIKGRDPYTGKPYKDREPEPESKTETDAELENVINEKIIELDRLLEYDSLRNMPIMSRGGPSDETRKKLREKRKKKKR